MAITNFENLIELLVKRGDRRRLAVVNGIDEHTQRAVEMALDKGFVDVVFVGGQDVISHNKALERHHEHITFVDAADPDDAARKAVGMVREGNADMLMKGRINTDNLLHAVLNKEEGMLPKGNVLTQITLTQLPDPERMVLFTDAAVIPFPNQEQRIAQVRYLVNAWHVMGEPTPRIALVHCSEKVDASHFPYTAGYKDIIAMAEKGEFGSCIVDGPLDIACSLSTDALKTKGLTSTLEGKADGLVFPNIEVGNVLHKVLGLFVHARTASVLQGAMTPVVLPSRGDTTEGKFLSIALAAL